ncbi:MAG: tyrosine-type recombinase/integrase [Candidatus Acidiferrales bacterium]
MVLTWHSFRHTHATLLTEAGESIKTAQSLLVHSDLETTLNTYSHVLPDSQRRALERVSEVLFSNVLKLDDGAKNRRINRLKNQGMVGPWGLEPQTSTVSR